MTFTIRRLCLITMVLTASACTWFQTEQASTATAATESHQVFTPRISDEGNLLFNSIFAIDRKVFALYNNCQSPTDLKKIENYFTEDLEFYQDTLGVARSRDELINSQLFNTCGKLQRHLINNSFNVFPLKKFGVITTGQHRFCPTENPDCDNTADFTMVWQNVNGFWRISRVISHSTSQPNP